MSAFKNLPVMYDTINKEPMLQMATVNTYFQKMLYSSPL